MELQTTEQIKKATSIIDISLPNEITIEWGKAEIAKVDMTARMYKDTSYGYILATLRDNLHEGKQTGFKDYIEKQLGISRKKVQEYILVFETSPLHKKWQDQATIEITPTHVSAAGSQNTDAVMTESFNRFGGAPTTRQVREIRVELGAEATETVDLHKQMVQDRDNFISQSEDFTSLEDFKSKTITKSYDNAVTKLSGSFINHKDQWKTLYRKTSAIFHPDLNSEDQEIMVFLNELNEIMKEVNSVDKFNTESKSILNKFEEWRK